MCAQSDQGTERQTLDQVPGVQLQALSGLVDHLNRLRQQPRWEVGFNREPEAVPSDSETLEEIKQIFAYCGVTPMIARNGEALEADFHRLEAFYQRFAAGDTEFLNEDMRWCYLKLQEVFMENASLRKKCDQLVVHMWKATQPRTSYAGRMSMVVPTSL